jgi:intracellular septation protein
VTPERKQVLRSIFVAGLLPVIAFTVIEEVYGTVAGLLAGMVFGVGEILFEWRTQGKVNPLTWGGNGLLLALGGLSLATAKGFWFKLQPSIMEAAMAAVLVGSVVLQKPLLMGMLEKQFTAQGRDPKDLPPVFRRAIGGMTLRTGVFLLLHALLAAWAAFHWSSTAWAVLKGGGLYRQLCGLHGG